MSPLNVHVRLEEQSATIQGSDSRPYHVTLDACTCKIFNVKRRKYGHPRIPCKHMLRLAMELEVSFDFPQFDPEKALAFDTEGEIARLSELWRSGIITAETFTGCSKQFQNCRKSAEKELKRKK